MYRVHNAFNIHVKVGQNIKTGVYQPDNSYSLADPEHDGIILPLYSCPRLNPVYVTEPDCIKIGKMEVDLRNIKGKMDKKTILVALCFSDTEITIRATKKQTGENLSTKLKYDW